MGTRSGEDLRIDIGLIQSQISQGGVPRSIGQGAISFGGQDVVHRVVGVLGGGQVIFPRVEDIGLIRFGIVGTELLEIDEDDAPALRFSAEELLVTELLETEPLETELLEAAEPSEEDLGCSPEELEEVSC